MLSKSTKRILVIILAFIIVFLLGNLLRFDRFDMLDPFGHTCISWVDCVKINDKTYSNNLRTQVESSSIGKKIGKVEFEVSKNVHNPSYKLRNGDATYLETGTEIYKVNSRPNEIAVKIEGKYYLYKVDSDE